jgi:hypothetical protein
MSDIAKAYNTTQNHVLRCTLQVTYIVYSAHAGL